MAAKSSPPPRQAPSDTLFFGLASRERGPSGKWRLRFHFGRIIGVVVLFLVIGYLAMCGVFFAYLRNKGYEETTYADALVLIFNREENRRKRATEHFDDAQQAVKDEEFGLAYRHLLFATRLDPSHLEARQTLAEFQAALNDVDGSLETLAGGLEYAGMDRDYIESYVLALLRAERDVQLIEFAEGLLEMEPEPEPEIRDLLAFAGARAHFFRGQYDDAESLLVDYDLLGDVPGILLIAQINWNRGQQELAIEQLTDGLARFPAADQLYAFLARYERERGNLETARRFAVLRNTNSPLSVGPRIGLLQIFKETGEDERAEAEASAILRQFRTDSNALMELGNYATNNGNTSLMRRIYQAALEENFTIAPFALLLVEARIADGDFDRAVDFCEQLDDESPEWLERQQGVFNSLRAVAHFGQGNEELCQLYLDRFLQTRQRVTAHSAIARRFEEIGGLLQARRVLEHAYEINPNNQNALTQLIAIELELGNSAEVSTYLRQLLQMRRPSESVLKEAYQKLSSDRFIFTPDRESILTEMRSLLNVAGNRPT